MARLWAYMLKEYDTDGTTEKYLGSIVKGSANSGYSNSNGTLPSTSAPFTPGDYIIPDIENQALTIQDVNNAIPIVSYGSNGGVRLMPVVGYQVAGQYSTKLYRENAAWWFDLALRKKTSTNKIADIPSFRVDRCYYDSDFTPAVIGEAYSGVKVGAMSITVGSGSPAVQMAMSLVGSRVATITTTSGEVDYAKEPSCSSYPQYPYTFRHCKVYADLTGGTLIPTKGSTSWTLNGLTTDKQLTTVRSVNLNFRNQLATTTHEQGLVDRILRTNCSLQFSIVLDLMDAQPNITSTVSSGMPQSTAFHYLYRNMRNSISGGNFSLAVVFDDGTQKIVIDLGSKVLQDGYTTVTPLPDMFAIQISGTVSFDPANCGVGLGGFDWIIQ